ncbi:MAG: phage tail protein, partial [bacterium]|nr:phage tail protein [bacterium]
MPLFAIAAAIASAVKWAFTATSAWALAARTAIMVGASYLVNRALAPSIQDAQSRQTYPFGPQTTEAQGGPIQVAYGTTRAHANIVGHYLVIADESGVQKNTEVSRHVLGCFGEGPWAAEPADTAVTLNGRPLSDYPDVTTEWRLGLVDQTVLTDWATHKQDYWVGQTCLYNEAITHTLKRTGFDEMSVILHWPKGFIHYGTDGDRHTEELSIKVEFGDAIADTWHTVAAGTISAKTALPAWKRIAASSSYAGGTPFTVTTGMRPRARVTLQTANSTNSRHIRDVEFAAVQVERAVGFTHPGMVLLDLATVPNEVLSGGITELSVETTGKVMQDEEGDFAVSRYHADAIRDMLTQPVIEGDGSVGDPWTASYYRGVDDSLLVGDGWADAKTLADTLVPDGNGNDVEMLRFDAVFSGGGSVHSATGQAAAAGRCGVRYIGRQYGLWVDEPRTPVGLLCDGNCERDSRQLTPVEVDELAAEASVRYSDADSGHSERTILVIDHDAEGLATVDLDLIGTTRTHEAARLARRELARNRLVDQAYACRTDIDGIVYEPGDVVYCQIDGRSTGGRVTAADATTVTLMRSVAACITGNDVICVQIRDAVTGVQSLEIQEVVSVSGDGKTITVASWDTQPSAGDVTLFGPADLLADDQFEVIETSLDEHLHVNLSLLKYAPVLDDLDAIAPTVYVPLGSLSRIARYGGVTRSDLPGVVIDRIGERGQIVFEWGRYTFGADDPAGGSISWATETDDDGDDAGYVNYNGTLYAPADGNTALTYVYWDPASPNVFSATDDLADLLDKYIVAKNDGGTPVLGFGWMPVTPGSASWSAIVDDDGNKPEDGATAGATWGQDIVGQPFDMQNLVKKPTFEDGSLGTWVGNTITLSDVTGQVWTKALASSSRHVIEYSPYTTAMPTC